MGKSNSRPPAGHYNANYGNFQTELYAQIRHEAFGEDIGQNSWLTLDEQDTFLKWLDLSTGKVLLDVACGAGGPALRIAATTGCSVVGIDVHEQALRRRVHLQPSAAAPNVPNFGLQMLTARYHFPRPALTPSPVSTPSTTSPTDHASSRIGPDCSNPADGCFSPIPSP